MNKKATIDNVFVTIDNVLVTIDNVLVTIQQRCFIMINKTL